MYNIAVVHVFHDYNLASILIVAILEPWLTQHSINCEHFFFCTIFAVSLKFEYSSKQQ